MCSYLYRIFFLFCFFSAYPALAVQPSFIKGTVYNTQSGTIIPQASISTTSGLSAQTDYGSFSLRVPPNIYDIIVSAKGFRSNMLTGVHAAPGKPTTVEIWLTPTAAETAILQGKVVESGSGDPIPAALVATDLGSLAATDYSGYFSMSTPAGTNTIAVAAAGYASDTQTTIDIPPHLVKQVTFYLDRAPASTLLLSGTVRNACSGSDISGARIATPSGETVISSNGSYSITLPSGPTTVIASAPGYEFYYWSFSSLPLPGFRTHNIDLIPSKNGSVTIQGFITDAVSGNPLNNVRLETDLGFATFSTSDGSYTLITSLCSQYLQARREGYASYSTRISLDSSAPLERNIEMLPHGTISGHVRDSADNHTIRHAEAVLNSDSTFSDSTGDNGTFSISNIPPGKYTLTVSHPCYDAEHTTAVVEPGALISEHIRLGTDVRGEVSGIIRDSITGMPVYDATITADHGSQTYSDADGMYSLYIPACTTKICADAEGYICRCRYVSVPPDSTKNLSFILSPCPIVFALTNGPPQYKKEILTRFRNIRDTMLDHNPSLQTYIDLYYDYADTLTGLLVNDTDLHKMLYDIVLYIYTHYTEHPSAESILNDDVLCEKAIHFIDRIMKKGSYFPFIDETARLQKRLRNGACQRQNASTH